MTTWLIPSDLTESEYCPAFRFLPSHFTSYGSETLPSKSALANFASAGCVMVDSSAENAKESGITSDCARAVAGNKTANPSAAANIETFTTLVIFMIVSFSPKISKFEFFIWFLIARAVSSQTLNRSMHGRQFIGKGKVKV